jgi:hypothetical protein
MSRGHKTSMANYCLCHRSGAYLGEGQETGVIAPAAVKKIYIFLIKKNKPFYSLPITK